MTTSVYLAYPLGEWKVTCQIPAKGVVPASTQPRQQKSALLLLALAYYAIPLKHGIQEGPFLVFVHFFSRRECMPCTVLIQNSYSVLNFLKA